MHQSRIVKRSRFNCKKQTYIGDPANSIKIFSDHCADEIMILNLDSTPLKTEDY